MISAHSRSSREECNPLPGIENIFVVVKTGATELGEKLPVHLQTTLRCIPNFEIFSDMEDKFLGHHIYDTLNETTEEIIRTNSDFILYRALKEHGIAGLQPSDVVDNGTNTNNGQPRNRAWNLDKWKFLPIIDKALKMRPNAKWYFIMETDTIIVWYNLVNWLADFDHTKPHYIGSQMEIKPQIFAHGGAGILISNPAMRMCSEEWRLHRQELEELTSTHWAGDCVLGKAMQNAGVPLLWSWPHLVPYSLAEVDFGAVVWEKRLWCHPMVTYHHIPTDGIWKFWNFQELWFSEHPNRPLLHKDVFEHYVLPQMAAARKDWDSLAEVEAENATNNENFDACLASCRRIQECLHFSYIDGRCRTSGALKLGRTMASENVTAQSGWMPDRISTFFRSAEECSLETPWIRD